MIPTTTQLPEFTIETEPSYTHALLMDKNIVQGMTDDADALLQAIYLILNTERYKHVIYSWNYGIELVDLIGREKSYVIPELERRISEALLQDDRITAVKNFEFEVARHRYTVSFLVESIYGTYSMMQEVRL